MPTLQSQLYEKGLGNVFEQFNAGKITEAQARAALGGGGGGTSSSAGVEAAKGFSTGLQNLLGTQKGEEANLFNLYQSAVAGQEKLPTMYKRIGEELGIPGQQQVVGGLRNEILRIEGLLEQLPEDVTQYTQGKFVTAAGRRRLEAERTEPLARALSTTGRAQERATGTLGEMTGALGTQMQLLTTEQQKELEPIKMRIDAFGDRAAREISGYTTGAQMELDAILKKIASDQEITEAETNRAHQLATIEKQYQLEKEDLKTEVITAGGQVKLINARTGAIIANLGASTTGGGGTAGERSTAELKASLADDIKRGVSAKDAINFYGDKLSLSDIKNIYNTNAASTYGPLKFGKDQEFESAEAMRDYWKKVQQEYGTIKTTEEVQNPFQ